MPKYSSSFFRREEIAYAKMILLQEEALQELRNDKNFIILF